MSCNPKCQKTASLAGPRGPRLMVSQPGNPKFPIPHTPHPQCPECAKEELAHAKLMVAFGNDLALVERYERLIAKGILDPV